MPIRQLSLFVENRPGVLGDVCRTLKAGGINISTLSLADTEQFGVLRLLVDDPDKARSVLEKAGFVAGETEVAALPVPNRPGGLADLLTVFDRYGINVEYMYAFPSGQGKNAVMVFRFEDPAKAADAFGKEGLEPLDAGDLF